MGEKLHAKIELDVVFEGLTPTELMIYFNRFIKLQQLESQSGRKLEVEVVESSINAITSFDDDGEEIDHLDENGRLQDSTGFEKALQKGLIGELSA